MWASKGAGGGSHVGAEAYAAGEPLEPPGGVVGRRREGCRRSLRCMLVFMKKVGIDVMLFCMCARMYVMCGVRHRIIHAERYTLVCVALHGVRGFKIT